MSNRTLRNDRNVPGCSARTLMVWVWTVAAGALAFGAEDPALSRQLILEPRGWESADLDQAEREIHRVATKQVERWNAWKRLFQGTDAYIAEVRQRLIEEHARILGYGEVAQAVYPSLCLSDGFVRFPMWGAYDGTSNREALAASIAGDKRRIAEELAAWDKGDVNVSFPFYPDFTSNGVKQTIRDWDRRIAEFEALVQRGELRIGGRPWYFGSANRNDLASLRRESERRWAEKENRLRTLGLQVTLREIGFASVADVDRELENTRRELRELEAGFARKDYGIDRLGMGGTRRDVEQRIASWQREIDERRQWLQEGVFRVPFPGIGGHSRKDFAQDNEEQRRKIAEIDRVVREGGYKVDVPVVGLVDGNFLRGVLARSKEAREIRDAQDGLRRIPVAAKMHQRFHELMILRNDQWAAAIPRMSAPAFVRPELDIQQAREFLAEYENEWALIKAHGERKLEWLARCRAALTGQPPWANGARRGFVPDPENPLTRAIAAALASGMDPDEIIRILQRAILQLETLRRERSGPE